MERPLYYDLLDKLSAICNSDNFLKSALVSARTKEEQTEFIQAIDEGKIKTIDDAYAFGVALEEARDKKIDFWAKQHGFDGAEPTGETWNDYDIYEPSYEPDEDGNYPCVGLPEFILVKEGEIRTTRTEKEIWDVYHLVYPPTEDDEEEDDEE